MKYLISALWVFGLGLLLMLAFTTDLTAVQFVYLGIGAPSLVIATWAQTAMQNQAKGVRATADAASRPQ